MAAAIPVFADTIITTSVFGNSPTGQVAAGAMSPIAEFEFLNDNSSRVMLNSLRFLLTETGSADSWTTAAAVSDDIGPIELFDDTGLQLGPSIVPATCAGATFTSTSFDCSFSALGFVLPRDSIRVLTVRLALQPATDITSIRASLLPSINFNAQQLDDGQDLLRVPLITVNANTLGVTAAAEVAVPEAGTYILLGLGMFTIAIALRLKRRRLTN